ncbi:hypothetical protein KTAU_44680 [Thermogemmatispora aurantia]|uniref:Uncharacterized protein n=1 Tax=Thermogemmatispora aurantia TaxID=2045279 RepID=A0A5J4KB81_9CHLR|nr:hypothetical protein KTAU_44680 [Thermogemmatispora aurantia]
MGGSKSTSTFQRRYALGNAFMIEEKDPMSPKEDGLEKRIF